MSLPMFGTLKWLSEAVVNNYDNGTLVNSEIFLGPSYSGQGRGPADFVHIKSLSTSVKDS